MKTQIKVEKEVEIQFLNVQAGVRYWESSEIDGVYDESGDLVPCRDGDNWSPKIDVDKGIIVNWVDGVKARIHYKVCDCCGWSIEDIEGNIVLSGDGYVPDTLCPEGEGFGDYVIMNISEKGEIEGWDFNIEDFVKSE